MSIHRKNTDKQTNLSLLLTLLSIVSYNLPAQNVGVKAVQELDAHNKKQQEIIISLKAQNDILLARIIKLENKN